MWYLSEKQGKDLAEFAGCDWYNDGESMLNTVDIDIVDICLPTFLHEQYVLLAAGHKKHVICEKPVTLSLESLDRMIAATKAAGVEFAVGQVVRFWPECIHAKDMVEAGTGNDLNLPVPAAFRSIPPGASGIAVPKTAAVVCLSICTCMILIICATYWQGEAGLCCQPQEQCRLLEPCGNIPDL